MAENSKIEWCHHTFNPWRGCAKVHTGCKNCFAEAQAKRNPNTLGIWGPNGSRVVASEEMWAKPLKWNKAAEKAGQRHRVFCASMADVFEDWDGECSDHQGNAHYTSDNDASKMVANWQMQGCDSDGYHYTTLDDVRRRLFALIDATPNLDWLLLTKRPENVFKMWPNTVHAWEQFIGKRSLSDPPPRLTKPNVWLGTSISDQATADNAIPKLLKLRALSPVLFLSAEPLVGPIEFSDVSRRSDAVKMLGKRALFGIDWVIVGGESGHNARPCDAEWIRSIRDQCQAAGVPCFVRQLGSRSYYSSDIDEDCQFTSYEQWVGKASSWLGGVSGGGVRYKKRENVVCVDTAGRQCLRGDGFMRARDEGTFPVRWHQVIEYVDPKGGDWEEWPADLRVRQFPTVEVQRA